MGFQNPSFFYEFAIRITNINTTRGKFNLTYRNNMYKHLENTLHQEDIVFQGKTTLPYSDMFWYRLNKMGI